MRKTLLGVLLGFLAGTGLAWAEADDTPKEDQLPPPKPTEAVAAPKPAGAAPVLPLPDGCGWSPSFAPATTHWERLPPDCRCGPPPGICPAMPCSYDLAPNDRVWFRAEYLIWWLRNDHLPPLATTGPPILPAGTEGGLATTSALDGRVDHGAFSGVRISFGSWLDDSRTFGLEYSFFILGQQTQKRTASENVLARPFFNLNANAPSSLLVSFPGAAAGTVSSYAPTDFAGFETNFRVNCYSCWDDRVDTIAGVRYLELDERLQVTARTAYTAAGPIPNAALSAVDAYHTRNQFYGGQVGAEVEFRRQCWYVHFRGKIGVGDTHETLEIAGGTAVQAPNGFVLAIPGGVLAQPSNIGRYSRDHFAVVPDVGFDLGYQVTHTIRISLGYSFLFWNDVIRPGGQPDFVVDVAQAPALAPLTPPTGLRRPEVIFKHTDFWAQGISVMAEVRY